MNLENHRGNYEILKQVDELEGLERKGHDPLRRLGRILAGSQGGLAS